MKNNSDSGISTIEALVAVAILAIAGTALLGGTSGAMSALLKAKTAGITAIAILKTDEVLRTKTGNILIPFWEKNVTIDVGNIPADIPWYEGIAISFLKVYAKDGVVCIETGIEDNTEILMFPKYLTNMDMRIVIREDQTPVGIDYHYTIFKTEYRTLALFGSSPLEKTK